MPSANLTIAQYDQNSGLDSILSAGSNLAQTLLQLKKMKAEEAYQADVLNLQKQKLDIDKLQIEEETKYRSAMMEDQKLRTQSLIKETDANIENSKTDAQTRAKNANTKRVEAIAGGAADVLNQIGGAIKDASGALRNQQVLNYKIEADRQNTYRVDAQAWMQEIGKTFNTMDEDSRLIMLYNGTQSTNPEIRAYSTRAIEAGWYKLSDIERLENEVLSDPELGSRYMVSKLATLGQRPETPAEAEVWDAEANRMQEKFAQSIDLRNSEKAMAFRESRSKYTDDFNQKRLAGLDKNVRAKVQLFDEQEKLKQTSKETTGSPVGSKLQAEPQVSTSASTSAPKPKPTPRVGNQGTRSGQIVETKNTKRTAEFDKLQEKRTVEERSKLQAEFDQSEKDNPAQAKLKTINYVQRLIDLKRNNRDQKARSDFKKLWSVAPKQVKAKYNELGL